MMRGRYWRALGNTPGHVQHFGQRAILDLVASRLRIVDWAAPVPWTVIWACQPARAGSHGRV